MKSLNFIIKGYNNLGKIIIKVHTNFIKQSLKSKLEFILIWNKLNLGETS